MDALQILFDLCGLGCTDKNACHGFLAENPRKCHLTISSEYGTNFLFGQFEHFHPLANEHTPRSHWFSQQGEYPFLPVFKLSNRFAKTSLRPLNNEWKNATFSLLDDVESITFSHSNNYYDICSINKPTLLSIVLLSQLAC